MGIFGRKKTDTSKDTAKPVEKKMEEKVMQKQPVEKKVAKKTAAKVTAVSPVKLLLQPLVTEKATVNGTYVFKVSKHATKNEVKKAFQAKYGKAPRKVNMLNVMGKTKFRGNQVGQRSDWKKAVVYLTKGETVDLYQ